MYKNLSICDRGVKNVKRILFQTDLGKANEKQLLSRKMDSGQTVWLHFLFIE